MSADAVDKLLNQWELECPGLNTMGLGVVVRVQNLGKFFKQQANEALSPLDLELWEYDVLSVLRRQGKPFAMPTTALATATRLSPGAMTNRIDKLEGKKYVRRITDSRDRRSVNVQLTAEGRRMTDRALRRRLTIANESIKSLSAHERSTLSTLLKKLALAD